MARDADGFEIVISYTRDHFRNCHFTMEREYPLPVRSGNDGARKSRLLSG